MVSDQEIAGCVQSLLRGSLDAGEASLSAVLQQAQAQLGVDLSHKAPYIRDQMDLFFGPRLPPPTTTAPAPPHPQPQTLPLDLQQQQQMMQQQQQFAPQYIFQTLPTQLPPPATATNTAVSAPPAVPAMAFYPPPPLAFRYANPLGGVATGGTVSFQQPAPGVGVGAITSPTPPAPHPPVGDNKER